MKTQIRGSQIIIPQMPRKGIITSVKAIFPASSMMLEIRGRNLLPKPCRLFLETKRTPRTA